MEEQKRYISAGELFDQLHALLLVLQQEHDTSAPVSKDYLKEVHELLVLTCHEGIRDTSLAFGNLFSQIDYLCNHLQLSMAEKRSIQEMRHHSNHPEQPLSIQVFLYDVRALCVLISKVFQTTIPQEILPLLPVRKPHDDT
ncbi:MAG: hypothetical protein IJR30_01340, partial [Prevotella sp.]|nr:hypothetical protein [Prevotella sp.]